MNIIAFRILPSTCDGPSINPFGEFNYLFSSFVRPKFLALTLETDCKIRIAEIMLIKCAVPLILFAKYCSVFLSIILGVLRYRNLDFAPAVSQGDRAPEGTKINLNSILSISRYNNLER